MAVNFQSLQSQIQKLGEGALQRERRLYSLRDIAHGWLQDQANDVARLRAVVEQAALENPSLRCARPDQEALNTHLPAPDLPDAAVMVAADGSQIAPDRHLPVDYYLINVGVILMRLGTHLPPETAIDSRLYYGDDLYTLGGRISEGLVTLQRDLAERRALADMTPAGEPLVVTLTDGPLELWGAKEGQGVGGAVFRESLARYKEALLRLKGLGAATAGYVDRPRADLVVRLLEIASLSGQEASGRSPDHPLLGVTDDDLFHEILGPGERSAVFGLQSQSVDDYSGALALHFFYLNTGRAGRPGLARVEIPRWVAEEPSLLDALHALLVQQCRALGARPYPYLLHRAHETAVVSLREKEQITQMIVLEWNRRGVPSGNLSAKQALKQL